MALLGNYSVLNKGLGRSFSGSTVSDTPDAWDKSGAARGRFASEGAFYLATSATPNAYQHPYCWILPQKDGASSLFGVSSSDGVGTLAASIGGDGALASGLTGSGDIASAAMSLLVNAVAALSGSGTIASADLSLILLAEAALSGSGSVTADITAQGALASALTGSGDLASAALGAIVSAVAELAGSSSVAGLLVGEGNMAADVSPFTVLSPESLAASVWAAIAVDNNSPGTMGEVLNAAGGGSTPSQVAAAVWAALRATNVDAGSMGETLVEMFELMGLDPTKPLVVTKSGTSVSDVDAGAGIHQDVVETATETTVTRA